MIFGNRIKEARKNKGLSQEELGRLIDVSKVSVCGYEKGIKKPNFDTLKKLLNVLDISFEYAIGEDKMVISDSDEEYKVKMCNGDIEIINEIKNHQELHEMLLSDPKRIVELIDRKINK